MFILGNSSRQVNDSAKSKQQSTTEMEDDDSGTPDAALTVSDADLASSRTPAKATPKKSPASPKIAYISLVQKAIENMNDRTGSSQPAIQKYILSNFPEVPEDKLKQRLLQTLKTGVANKRFIKVKDSFKIHPDIIKKKKVLQKNGMKKMMGITDYSLMDEKEKQKKSTLHVNLHLVRLHTSVLMESGMTLDGVLTRKKVKKKHGLKSSNNLFKVSLNTDN